MITLFKLKGNDMKILIKIVLSLIFLCGTIGCACKCNVNCACKNEHCCCTDTKTCNCNNCECKVE